MSETHLANQWTLKKKFERLIFPILNMESPKVQKVSHWLSMERLFFSVKRQPLAYVLPLVSGFCSGSEWSFPNFEGRLNTS